VQRCEVGAARGLAQLDAALVRAPYLLGEPSLADLACVPYIHAAFIERVIDFAPYAHVTAWLDRVHALPGFIPLESA